MASVPSFVNIKLKEIVFLVFRERQWEVIRKAFILLCSLGKVTRLLIIFFFHYGLLPLVGKDSECEVKIQMLPKCCRNELFLFLNRGYHILLLVKYWWNGMKIEERVRRSHWALLCPPHEVGTVDRTAGSWGGPGKVLITHNKHELAWQYIHAPHADFRKVVVANSANQILADGGGRKQ